jgi:hypothetical protein
MLDKVTVSLFVIAVAFLAFVLWAFASLMKVFPYGYLNDAYLAMVATYSLPGGYDTLSATRLWRKAQPERRGVTISFAQRPMMALPCTRRATPKKPFFNRHGRQSLT